MTEKVTRWKHADDCDYVGYMNAMKCNCRLTRVDFVPASSLEALKAENERLLELLTQKKEQKQAVEDENDRMLMALKEALPLCDGAIKGGYVRQYNIVRDIEQAIKNADPDFYYSEVLNRPTGAALAQGGGPDHIPLARAQQLQQAMTVIAERCEELRADSEAGKIEEGEVLKALIGTGERARKALTEFERKE